jgi:hypothetical protein
MVQIQPQRECVLPESIRVLSRFRLHQGTVTTKAIGKADAPRTNIALEKPEEPVPPCKTKGSPAQIVSLKVRSFYFLALRDART